MKTGAEYLEEFNSQPTGVIAGYDPLEALIDRVIFEARKHEADKLYEGLKSLQKEKKDARRKDLVNGIQVAANYVFCHGQGSGSGENEVEGLNEMAARVVAMCKKRGWSLHWTHRGAYLHLESSELIEAIRGKNGDPGDEAGDVLLVLMSITEYAGIPFSKVIENAKAKLTYLEEAPPYPGEERSV